MKTMWFAVLLVAVVVAASLPTLAMDPGTFVYAGYTITVTPDDPAHPGQAGAITVVNDDASVNLAGTYAQTTTRPPSLVIDLAGTIATAEGTQEVQKTFTFAPQTKRQVWKSIVAWIESLLAA